MSAIVGIFTSGDRPAESVARRMLDRMRTRGADRVAVWRGEGALLAVARHEWEMHPDFSGDALVVEDDDLVVAADASVYYRADLRRALDRRGVAAAGDTPSHLVLAAYRAWGDDCAARLEGDFAYIVWNRKTRRLCAARDFSGKRTLYYAEPGDTLIVASTISAVVAHPQCPGDFNYTSLAETAGGLFAASHETCYAAVRALPAGWTLARREGGRGHAELRRHWSPPPMRERDDLSFEEGAEALRELLVRSVMERTVSGGPTSVWLSGGWDSTAVFGAGKEGARRLGESTRELLPVSMSYPPGDPGREDELIQAVADHWGARVHWVNIADVPFFDRPAERAARRDEPFAHPFEMWHRALARGSRAVGSRVALEGVGGDQLFQVSEVFLADLLRAGRWGELAREWREKGMRGTGFRNFFRWAVQPLLPAPALAIARVLRRGRPLVGHLERRPPEWLDAGFVRRHRLEERERAFTPQRRRGTCAAYETEWYLTHPYFPRVFGLASAFALEEGVEIRSPLYDRRVIEFALTRPRWERSSGPETKRLLRAAVRGLLPDVVLAPRPARTGGTGGYFDRSMRERFPALQNEMLSDSVLVRAGIIDAYRFRQLGTSYVKGGSGQLGVNLFFTLQTELWLRARLEPTDALVGKLPAEPTVMVAG
ncbi:MAG TPA: asparagine synthase-related protein [Gemmatimonadaceae bacterium]